MALIVCSLDKAAHDRPAFDCGEPALNDFLRTKAARHQSQRLSRTFVLVDDGEPSRILGYYSLANCHIDREGLTEQEARKLPKYPIPGVRLARLAVDLTQQGRQYGLLLLMDAIKRCVLVSLQSGVYALVVDAKNEAAKRFYKRFGFCEIAIRPMTVYLPLATGLKAVQSAQSAGSR